jgi:superfamily II DNA/RNA helicase
MPKHNNPIRDNNSGASRSHRKDAPYSKQPQQQPRRQDNNEKSFSSRAQHRRSAPTREDDTDPCRTFDDMNLKADLLKGIYAYGFEKPSAIQQRAIRPIVRGRDVIAQSQSGTGKTAVFSIAALQLLDETSRDVQVLVLSPTRELAEQSQRVLQSLGDFMNVREPTTTTTTTTTRHCTVPLFVVVF